MEDLNHKIIVAGWEWKRLRHKQIKLVTRQCSVLTGESGRYRKHNHDHRVQYFMFCERMEDSLFNCEPPQTL